MRTLVISDTHLDSAFDTKKFNFLKKIIKKADRVIINGDFWEGYKITFDTFVNSPWKKLFPLLKEKKAIYLYGNHDKESYVDKRVNLFSVKQAKRYRFTSGKNTFFLEHGDRLAPLWDKFFRRMPFFILIPLDNLERFLVQIFGKAFLRFFYGRFNKKIKEKIEDYIGKNEFFIFGHIPVQEIDRKNHFINGGFIKYGIGQYLFIEEGRVTLKEEWYGRPLFKADNR